MSLKDESELENSFPPGMISQNCSWGSGWYGRRSVNMQFDIKLANSVTRRRW